MEVYLLRHGETEWSRARRHTSSTDLSLLPEGRTQSEQLCGLLGRLQLKPEIIFTSPLARARETASIVFPGRATEHSDQLKEFDYGDYEGLTSVAIRERDPHWDIWRDGCPGGETIAAAAARADMFIERLKTEAGPAAVVSHGHMLRVLAARLLGVDAAFGKYLTLYAGTLSVLLADHHGTMIIDRWNMRSSD